MPTANPRLTITLTPGTAAIMRRLSELTGNSQSALIAELLEANESTFARLITVLEAAVHAKATLAADAKQGLAAAQERLEQQLGLVLGEMDAAMAPILQEAEKVQRRTRRRGAASLSDAPRAAAPTPPSNRGVRSDPKTAKKSTRTRT